MGVDELFEPLAFNHGPAMKNRFMLAPMTNQQSHEDGTVLDDEIQWLAARAHGGFGHVNTCCSHVEETGKGFPGELGIFADSQVPGLAHLASAIRRGGANSHVQLYHGGARALADRRVGPSDDIDRHVRALRTEEVDGLVEAFACAAHRAESAGFDGIQVHAAHGYLIGQFLSTGNQRTDEYGGSPENRARFLLRIVSAIRRRCHSDFQLGVRLSLERFGQDLFDSLAVAQRLFDEGQVDYLDFSLWDVFKKPEDDRARGRSLMSYCMDLDRGDCRVGVAGKIISPEDAMRCLNAGADFVSLGKVAILNHDYPARLRQDPGFKPFWRAATRGYLHEQGLGSRFIDYLSTYTHPVFAELDPNVPSDQAFDIDDYIAGKH